MNTAPKILSAQITPGPERDELTVTYQSGECECLLAFDPMLVRLRPQDFIGRTRHSALVFAHQEHERGKGRAALRA